MGEDLMVRFSILVPVYNGEKYINECIDSILNQTYENFELIIVDDGSTDNSGVICDSYAKKDERIRVFHQENKGLYMTRIVLAEKISGEYGVFVDADDYVTEDWLEKVNKSITKTNADIVIYDFNKETSKGGFLYYNTIVGFPKSTIIESEELNKIYEQYFSSNRLNQMFTKVIKSSYLRDISNFKIHEGLSTGEDAVFVSGILSKVKKIYYLKEALYFYRFNQKSITNTVSLNKMQDWDIMLKTKHDFRMLLNVDDNKSLEKMASYCIEMCIHKIVLITSVAIPLKEKVELLKKIKDEFFYKEYSQYIRYEVLSSKRKIVYFLLKNSLYYALLLLSKTFLFFTRISNK